MSLLEEKDIVWCQCCGNRDQSKIARREDGYVCKCCGVWYKKSPTDKELREQIQCEQGFSRLRAYRFGDARDTFQIILQNNPDNINALWGILLARFGVVYIKGFYKGVVEPIYCFPNYERMKSRYVQSEPEYRQIMDLLKNETALRFDYEKKAEAIDDALDDFKKYKKSTERDVFICVKISAATTNHPELKGRTKDYEFALEIYNELTRRGVNAFFSYVTLENDVKSDEKIWRNLVKSKKMLLIGSSKEYLESPWVKSEWKRWLHLKREEELYVCTMPSADETPFDVLPQELYELEQQIYTPSDKERLIAHICKGVLPESTQTVQPPEPVKPPTPINQDGKIVYKDGHEEVLQYGMTEIKEKAYYENENIVSVVLPNTVTKIGYSAFSYCSSLASITIPNSFTEIYIGAFQNCRSLASITIPDSVTEIGSWAFHDCGSLKDIYYNGSKEQWRTIKVDDHNDALTKATVHFTDPTKQDGKIVYKNGREEVLKYGITRISPSDFPYIKDIRSIFFPEGVKSFQCKEDIVSVLFPKSVTEIGYKAFENCSSLVSVTIPDNVTEIGWYAFENCSSLVSITIPDSVTRIGRHAFSGCSSLKDIYYGGSAFAWMKIKIEKDGNGKLVALFGRAKIHYNSK